MLSLTLIDHLHFSSTAHIARNQATTPQPHNFKNYIATDSVSYHFTVLITGQATPHIQTGFSIAINLSPAMDSVHFCYGHNFKYLLFQNFINCFWFFII